MSADKIETEGDWHWRNSMKPARFFALDARAAIPIFLLILPTGSARLFIFMFSILAMGAFWWLERLGLTFPAAMRAIRAWILGKKRPAIMWFKRHKMIDYG